MELGWKLMGKAAEEGGLNDVREESGVSGDPCGNSRRPGFEGGSALLLWRMDRD